MSHLLTFEPFHSTVSPELWHDMETKKLHEFKLDDSAKPIVASYTMGQTQYGDSMSSRMRLGGGAFVSSGSMIPEGGAVDALSCVSPGLLYNANTAEEFKNLDKRKLLKEAAWSQLLQPIRSGQWLERPSLLTSFILLSFADLKSHRFVYWFAWPALSSVKFHLRNNGVRPLLTSAEKEQKWEGMINAQSLNDCFEQHRLTANVHHRGFFLLAVSNEEKSQMQVYTVGQWEEAFALQDQAKTHKIFLTMMDPSALSQHPNWMLRSYLMAAALTFGRTEYSVLCLRQSAAGRSDYAQHSIVMDLQVVLPEGGLPESGDDSAIDSLSVTGWEKNTAGTKTAPRLADIGASMDPIKLAESSVTLNLNLMKWRMFPSLDVDTLARTRCLLIGSGTLGCHVARNLIAWGIMNMTFVDRSRVSFSNPVRQPLFHYEDCLNGGKLKAQAAAEHMKQIYPLVNAAHQNMDIPMPGHIVTNEKETKGNVKMMEQLIEEHDAVFLLTDTRESRWLPTVIAAAKEKLVINTALGFESYLVVRHGLSDSTTTATGDAEKLGCYFCNDVVAPVDSTKDRTLDQQCTVTRPGVSATASALSVELLVSLLHHPQRGRAPADGNSELGALPHQIRGSLTTFNNNNLTGRAYHQCTACSNVVVNKYRSEGFSFLKSVFNDSSVLEELTGLKELHERTQKMLDDIELVDDDDDKEEEFELV